MRKPQITFSVPILNSISLYTSGSPKLQSSLKTFSLGKKSLMPLLLAGCIQLLTLTMAQIKNQRGSRFQHIFVQGHSNWQQILLAYDHFLLRWLFEGENPNTERQQQQCEHKTKHSGTYHLDLKDVKHFMKSISDPFQNIKYKIKILATRVMSLPILPFPGASPD